MDLKQLVAEARKQSPEFDQKIRYWTEVRGKTPDFKWLMEELENALGRDYCQAAAKAFIESMNFPTEPSTPYKDKKTK